MAPTETRPWDPAEHIATEHDVLAYLNAALETGEPQLVTSVLGDIARSEGMTTIAAACGLGRESLYKSLSPEGNPAFSTVLKVLDTFNLRLQAVVAPPAHGETGPFGAFSFLSSEQLHEPFGDQPEHQTIS